MGVTVSTSARFTIGGRDAGDIAAREGEKAVSEIRAIIAATDSLLRSGRAMDALRRTENLALIGECGRRMRENLARHESLDHRVMALPSATPGRGYVIGALGSARMCSTSVDDAQRWCRDAAEQLGEARAALRTALAEKNR